MQYELTHHASRSRRAACCALVLALFSSAAYATITFDAANSYSTGTSAPSKAFPATTITAGAVILVGVNINTNADYVSSITDDKGDTFTRLCEAHSASLVALAVYYAPNAVGGSTTITVHYSPNSAASAVFASYTGVPAASPIDAYTACTYNGASTSQTSPSVTTTAINELIVGLIGAQNATSIAPAAGENERQENPSGGSAQVEDKASTTTGGYTTSWTLGGSKSAIVAAVAIKNLAPTFTANPTVGTRTTSSIPITATSACTDCTFNGVATVANSAPTCTQIKAGQNSSGSAAYKSFSQAMTANVQATGTFSGYTDGTVKYAWFCLNSAANGDGSVYTALGAIYKIPAFSAGPTFSSCTATGCTYALTLDGAGTVYGVACLRGSTPSTVTQVEAGNCTGNVAAVASANKSVSGADTLLIGSALSYPTHDFYIVGTYGSQHEAAVHADSAREMLPPTGYAWIKLTSVASTSPCAALSSPSVATPDYFIVSNATSPDSLAMTIYPDCSWSYPASSSRESFLYGIYDDSAQGWMTGCGLGFSSQMCYFWANNVAPTFSPNSQSRLWRVGDVIDEDFCAEAIDPDDDAAVLTLTNSSTGTGTGADKRPAGTSFGGTNNCHLSGTLTTVATGTFSVTATDVPGDAGSMDIDWEVRAAQETVPDCTTANLDLSTCVDDSVFQLQYLNWDATGQCSDAVPLLGVISSNPAAGASVDPGTTVHLVVSAGCARGHRAIDIGIGIGIN